MNEIAFFENGGGFCRVKYVQNLNPAGFGERIENRSSAPCDRPSSYLASRKMFAKDNSSLYTKGKRAKDIPVRKSDRKKLLGTVREQLGAVDSSSDNAGILESCFLKGALMKRSIKLPSAMVDLFLRCPSIETEEEDLWPYMVHPQCVWLQVDENRVVFDIPGLALLAVLPKVGIQTALTPPQVSKFVCRGANVMRAGIFGMERMNGSRVCAVVAQGNPRPYAVGLLHPNLCENPKAEIGPGKQGTGVAVVQSYGDDIWRQQQPGGDAHGSSVDDGNFGNKGFVGGEIVHPVIEGKDGQAAIYIPDNATCESSEQVESPEESVPGAHEENESRSSPEQVLHDAVCKSLALLSIKKDLPMRIATFYGAHVLKNRPADTIIELKQTKYKKFGVYIADIVESGLVTVGKDEQQDPSGLLVSYNRSHPDIQRYINAESGTNAVASITSKKLVLTELYCIPNHFTTLLRLDPDTVKGKTAASPLRRNKGTLTLAEIRDILESYVSREQLVRPERQDLVQLDGPLTDALFKSKKSKLTNPVPEVLSRKELLAKWKEKMEPAYALVELPGNTIVDMGRGKPPCVSIEVSRRQSNKFVTRATGLQKFGIDPVVFAKDVSHRFACAASTEGLDAVVQGNMAVELQALLVGDPKMTSHGGAKNSTYCIPKNAVEVHLRKGVPKRKK